MEPTNELEFVKNKIMEVFNFLQRDYYYTPTYNIEKSNIFIQSLEVEYINEIKRRKVGISYTKREVDNEIKYNFTATISRIPYSGQEDFFSLDTYLQSIEKCFSSSLINKLNMSEVENILSRIADALKKYASKIIEGKDWLEIYYPRRD